MNLAATCKALVNLGASALWTVRRITSRGPLDAWGATVLRRGVRAAWLTLATLLGLHLAFWATDGRVALASTAPIALLLCTRFVRSEGRRWGIVGLAGALGTVFPSGYFAVYAGLACVVLVLMALRHPTQIATAGESPASAPYRTVEAEPKPPRHEHAFGLAPRPERVRLLSGAAIAAYLCVWSVGGNGYDWPPHSLLLNAALVVAAVGVAWRYRARAILVGVAGLWLHIGIDSGMLTAPRTIIHWALCSVVTGFVLLAGSLGLSFRLSRQASAEPKPET